MKLRRPPISSANHLLASLLCNPVSLRTPALFAVVRDLLTGAQLRADTGTDESDDECMPWEEPIYEVIDGIAFVPISGPIVKGYDALTCWWYGLMSTDALQAALLEISDRADIAAVVFNLNSPGGCSAGMPECADQIVALGQQKLTVAFVGDQACSNGYRLACACSLVLATRSATVGCIGTYIALYDYTEMLTKMGIKLELFAEGDYKAMGLEGNPLTDKQRAFLQATTKRSNDMFTSFVKSRRPDVKDETMQGQWFDGEQGVALGLVDRVVSGLPEVVDQIRASMQPAVATLGA
jgi:signal peptide peptidase SppA